ncbi:AraC family transcriptional regulator [Oscillatoria sp. CS-180]|uniref:helix-turn-helix transcriptional regulator n=1 Tax=Oscillatoria sp. CS-180 TaxID=3021720 RepID=UPI00232F4011|nr:AraC family transcriptional regulator [Oscillatoria sp. CS-180]MDB9527185.1 AraC family transcriptional regulator [Oscillatoria sp. CS-180]
MEVSLAFTNIQHATQEFQKQAGGTRQLQSTETALFFPTTLGQGYMRGIHLRDGLDLFIYECDLKQDLLLDFRRLSSQYSMINLTFCLSGYCTGMMPGLKNRLDVSAQQTTFSAVPYAAGTTKLFAGKKISVVELAIAPTYMLTLIERHLSALPLHWQQNIQNAASTPCFQLNRTTPEIARILYAILHCPHESFIRQLYLEGKVLELIALYFAQLKDYESAPSALARVRRKDVDALHQAKKILLKNLGEPPSLAELAHQVGLSERKLQQGFRQLFGNTVFGVLHDHRMEQARQLLEADQMTITAIANAVGITHRGYFATAFKRKFGSTPREYLKRFK